MAKFKPQFYRLQEINRKIAQLTYPTCRSLGDDLEVSEKTIQRDLDYMRDFLQSPIEYDHAKRGYYFTEPNYHIPWIDITESDLFAVCIADRALAAYEDTPIYEKLAVIFDKIQNTLPEKVRVNVSWLGDHYSFIREPHTFIKDDIWETIARSLMDKKELIISHRKPGYTASEKRPVHPYHIASFSGEWYLIAFCTVKSAIRRFAVSRIESAEATANAYIIPDDFNIHEYLGKCFGIIDHDEDLYVVVRFSKDQAPYILERKWHESQTAKENEDGTVDLSFSASSLFEVKRWVLSWGADAVVLEPPGLVADVTGELHKMIKVYKDFSS